MSNLQLGLALAAGGFVFKGRASRLLMTVGGALVAHALIFRRAPEPETPEVTNIATGPRVPLDVSLAGLGGL